MNKHIYRQRKQQRHSAAIPAPIHPLCINHTCILDVTLLDRYIHLYMYKHIHTYKCTHICTGKENNGILQQFLLPSTPCVSTIRAYWTSHYCNIESRINNHPVDALQVPIGQRLVTFEGDLYHSLPNPMGSRVKSRIQKVISKIVGYVQVCI